MAGLQMLWIFGPDFSPSGWIFAEDYGPNTILAAY
jgi:hypothetical protein